MASSAKSEEFSDACRVSCVKALFVLAYTILNGLFVLLLLSHDQAES
jgi:hypothetical protein